MVEEEFVLETKGELRFAPPADPIELSLDNELEQDLKRIPDKMAFKIGEVAELVGVKPYVLRYWETEFEALKPKKSKNNQRMYERRDVETLMTIKKLLYRDRFSIEGARAALKKMRRQSSKVREIRSMTEQVEDIRQGVYELLGEIRRVRRLFY